MALRDRGRHGSRSLEVNAERRLRAGGRSWIPFLAGLLLGLAWPPVAWPYAAPAAIAVFSLVLERASGIRSAWFGLVFGLGYMGTTLWWLSTSIAPAAWVALSILQALWFAPLGWLLSVVRGLPWWPLWSALCWQSVELLRAAWPFGGFPWARLGTIVIDTPWAALLPLVGILGTGLVVALGGFGSAAVVALVRRRRRNWVKLLSAVVGAALASLLPASIESPVAPSGSMTVGVVQGGVPGNGTDVAGHHREVTRNLLRTTRRLARQVGAGLVAEPDLVVWPENSTAVDPAADERANRAIETAVAIMRRPLLVGAMVDATDPETVLNQSIVWEPSDGPSQRYTKRHPVPFGEYIPFRSVLAPISPLLSQIPRDMVPGQPSPPLDVAGSRTAIAICFDVAFDDVISDQVRAGAEFVVVQTSNAMFTGTAQPEQQFAISRARALEAGRTVVVASLNGVSGVISPSGVVLRQIDTRGADTLVVEIPLMSNLTPATRWGPRIEDSVLGLTLVPLLWLLMRGLRRRMRRATA